MELYSQDDADDRNHDNKNKRKEETVPNSLRGRKEDGGHVGVIESESDRVGCLNACGMEMQ